MEIKDLRAGRAVRYNFTCSLKSCGPLTVSSLSERVSVGTEGATNIHLHRAGELYYYCLSLTGQWTICGVST